MDKHIGVVMLSPSARPAAGGMQKQALSLAEALQAQGFHVVLVTQRRAVGQGRGAGGAGERQSSGMVSVTPLFALRALPGWSFLCSFFIWACLHRRGFQIIHAHDARLGVIASLVSWPIRKAVVVKIPSKVNVGYLDGATLFRRLRRWIVTRRAACIVAVSTEMARGLEAVGIEPEKIVMIPNGIDIASTNDNYDRLALKTALLGNADLPVVLFVGRLVEEKGVERLLKVWAAMPCHENLRLFIVGDGPLKEGLEAMAGRLNLRSSVWFLGQQAEVAKFYAMADVFTLPSLTEGMSNALLEAMAAGLPTVVSDVGGNKDVVEDRESGFLVEWEDTLSCVEVLTTLLADPDLRQRVGSAAKRRARAFDLGHIAHRYQQLYSAILQK
jgi:glycosyltransferase involved in cell wall biosynthesis